jgi:hypothetical protein
MPDLTMTTSVHVLWAARCKPAVDLIHCVELGLKCTRIDTVVDAAPLTDLRSQFNGLIDKEQLILVVTDTQTCNWAETARTACAEAGCNPPVHLMLANESEQASVAGLAIRALVAVLNTGCPVGIDVEDVRMALTGGSSTRIATAQAMGNTRAQDAMSTVSRDLGLASPDNTTLSGLLVIFAGSSSSLTLKEAGTAIKQLQPNLDAHVQFAYCLLHDESLGEALQLFAFASL